MRKIFAIIGAFSAMLFIFTALFALLDGINSVLSENTIANTIVSIASFIGWSFCMMLFGMNVERISRKIYAEILAIFRVNHG